MPPSDVIPLGDTGVKPAKYLGFGFLTPMRKKSSTGSGQPTCTWELAEQSALVPVQNTSGAVEVFHAHYEDNNGSVFDILKAQMTKVEAAADVPEPAAGALLDGPPTIPAGDMLAYLHKFSSIGYNVVMGNEAAGPRVVLGQRFTAYLDTPFPHVAKVSKDADNKQIYSDCKDKKVEGLCLVSLERGNTSKFVATDILVRDLWDNRLEAKPLLSFVLKAWGQGPLLRPPAPAGAPAAVGEIDAAALSAEVEAGRRGEMERLRQELAAVEAQRAAALEAAERAERDRDKMAETHKQTRGQVEELRAEVEAANRRAAAAEAAKRAAEAAAKEAAKRADAAVAGRQAAEASVAALQEECAALKKKAEAAASDAATLRRALKDAEATLAAAKAELKALRGKGGAKRGPEGGAEKSPLKKSKEN